MPQATQVSSVKQGAVDGGVGMARPVRGADREGLKREEFADVVQRDAEGQMSAREVVMRGFTQSLGPCASLATRLC